MTSGSLYEAFGYHLSGSEYAELKALVENDDPKALADSHLMPTGSPYEVDADYASIYHYLHEGELVDGTDMWASKQFYFDAVSERGRQFIADCEDSRSAKRREIWSNRTFQIALSIGTVIVSVLLSLAVSMCSYSNIGAISQPANQPAAASADNSTMNAGIGRPGF